MVIQVSCHVLLLPQTQFALLCFPWAGTGKSRCVAAGWRGETVLWLCTFDFSGSSENRKREAKQCPLRARMQTNRWEQAWRKQEALIQRGCRAFCNSELRKSVCVCVCVLRCTRVVRWVCFIYVTSFEDESKTGGKTGKARKRGTSVKTSLAYFC